MKISKLKTTIALASVWVVLLAYNSCNTAGCNQTLPEDRVLKSVNDGQVAMDGYDVTAFFTDNKPVKGVSRFSSDYRGATYYFASQKVKDLFDLEPARYTPEFGGFCAVAASFNKVEPAQIDLFDIYGGKLYLARNEKAQKMWNENKQEISERAEGLWPCLVSQNGKKL